MNNIYMKLNGAFSCVNSHFGAALHGTIYCL